MPVLSRTAFELPEALWPIWTQWLMPAASGFPATRGRLPIVYAFPSSTTFVFIGMCGLNGTSKSSRQADPNPAFRAPSRIKMVSRTKRGQ